VVTFHAHLLATSHIHTCSFFNDVPIKPNPKINYPNKKKKASHRQSLGMEGLAGGKGDEGLQQGYNSYLCEKSRCVLAPALPVQALQV
jgi:hypothetical protein